MAWPQRRRLLCPPPTQLLAGQSKPPTSMAEPAKRAAEARGKMAVARSALLRANGGFLPEPAFRQRKAFFVAKVLAATYQRRRSTAF